MSLILGISSSSPQFNLLLGENGKILFSQGAKLSMANRQDITMLLEEALQETGKTIKEIEKIIVDIGPGGTSIVRTGVAFANALSYSLNIPVCPVSSLELLCLEAWEKHEKPVITFIKSLKQNVYLGLYNGKDLRMKYGQFEEVVPDAVNELQENKLEESDLQEIIVVGYNRERLIEAYPNKQIHDSGIQFANPKYLIEQWERFTDKSFLLPNLPVPITEQDIMNSTSENTIEAVECLQNGGAVLLPTDTVYGLAASPNPSTKVASTGVDKVFNLKQRPRDRHLPIMVASSEQLLALGVDINPAAQKIIASELIPGDMTLVLGFKDKPLVPWLEGRDEIAFRVPKHEWLLKVLEATGPLLVTSANKHGGGITPNNVSEILKDLNGEPDMVVDGGLVENIPSTILNCRVNPIKIERPGGIRMEEIVEVIERDSK